mgnify:CR=1
MSMYLYVNFTEINLTKSVILPLHVPDKWSDILVPKQL